MVVSENPEHLWLANITDENPVDIMARRLKKNMSKCDGAQHQEEDMESIKGTSFRGLEITAYNNNQCRSHTDHDFRLVFLDVQEVSGQWLQLY
jgi:hypothetical protein